MGCDPFDNASVLKVLSIHGCRTMLEEARDITYSPQSMWVSSRQAVKATAAYSRNMDEHGPDNG